jgi:hypothetical protein
LIGNTIGHYLIEEKLGRLSRLNERSFLYKTFLERLKKARGATLSSGTR